MNIDLYRIRIIISLMDGLQKSALQIADEWHGKYANPDKQYRNRCRQLAKKNGLLKSKPKDKNSKHMVYSLNFKSLSKHWSELLKTDITYVTDLLQSNVFRGYIKSFVNTNKDSRKDLINFEENIIIYYLNYLLANDSLKIFNKKRLNKDISIINKIYKYWEKNKIDPNLLIKVGYRIGKLNSKEQPAL